MHDIYRGKDCMKKFCESLREHAMKMINFKKKTMKLLTKEMQESYENAKICYICQEKLENKYVKDKKYCKVKDHNHYTGEYRGAAHSICNLKYSVPKKMPIAFHNGFNYDSHFIIKELAEELKKQFTCLGENTEKYISARFMATSLSNLVNNLFERIHKIKCKCGQDNKKCETL